TDYVCGFISQNGSGNTFDSCSSQATTALAANEFTSGILLGGESNSTITNCHVIGTQGTANTCGIYLETNRGIKNNLNSIATTTTTVANGALSVDWLQYSKNYLAVGSAANSHIDIPSMATVFEFTGSTLDTVATITAPLNIVNAVSWRRNGTPHYLATGGVGFVPAPRNALSVYQFSGSALDYVTSATALAMNPLSVDWFDGTNYLAAGSIATNEVRVYHFTGSNLDLVATVTTPGWDQALSVACLVDGTQKYIAVGGASGSTPTPNVVTRIYEFTGTNIEYRAQITAPATDQVWGVAWLADGGTNYLATCGLANLEPVNKESIKTYTFTGSTLTPLATPASSGNNWPLSVAWFTDGASKYLAVGESAGTGATKTELMKIF
ncbi:MAG: hypothetical protein U1E13_04035, partial [Methylophilaceae bacterium]|nr:hypothetical protein [Methylophilaceae bacterium]